MNEKVILVDTKDQVMGEMDKLEAHRKGERHRAVSVFIFNANKQLLLQKRALSKYHSPGLWTNTACTHPRRGETNKAAAIRRLQEEMGIVETRLHKAFDFIYYEELENGMIEHELDHVFVAWTDHMPIPNPSEVADFKYIAPDVLLKDIQAQPKAYTVWFKMIIERVINSLE